MLCFIALSQLHAIFYCIIPKLNFEWGGGGGGGGVDVKHPKGAGYWFPETKTDDFGFYKDQWLLQKSSVRRKIVIFIHVVGQVTSDWQLTFISFKLIPLQVAIYRRNLDPKNSIPFMKTSLDGKVRSFRVPPLRFITAKCVILRCKVWRTNLFTVVDLFVHHAKFHCIMTTLNRLFKIELERWGGGLEKRPKVCSDLSLSPL